MPDGGSAPNPGLLEVTLVYGPRTGVRCGRGIVWGGGGREEIGKTLPSSRVKTDCQAADGDDDTDRDQHPHPGG